MHINDVLKHKGQSVRTIAPDRTVRDAICEMNLHHIGCLVVTDDAEGIQGIITERDVLRMCGERCVDLDKPQSEEDECPAQVSEVMTQDVFIALPEDSIDYAMGVMTANRVRHLPVVADERLAGLVSIGDLVRASLGESKYENRMLRSYISGAATF